MICDDLGASVSRGKWGPEGPPAPPGAQPHPSPRSSEGSGRCTCVGRTPPRRDTPCLRVSGGERETVANSETHDPPSFRSHRRPHAAPREALCPQSRPRVPRLPSQLDGSLCYRSVSAEKAGTHQSAPEPTGQSDARGATLGQRAPGHGPTPAHLCPPPACAPAASPGPILPCHLCLASSLTRGWTPGPSL